MNLKVRLAGALAAVAAGLVVASSVLAQAYPSRPIRILIGYGAGGTTDIILRVFAEDASRRLGQPIVVENRVGANGLLAANPVKAAPPDGYNLFGGDPIGFHPMFMKTSMDGTKELTPIAALAVSEFYLHIPAGSPVRTLKEFAEYAKSRQPFRAGSPSPVISLLYAVLAKRLGFEVEVIPYKTTDQTLAALLSGDIGFILGPPSGGNETMVQAGKLRVIASLSPARSAMKPNIPIAKELGIDFEFVGTNGLWGPLGLPSDIVGKLSATAGEALKTPAVVEKLRNVGLEPAASAAPEQFLKTVNNGLALFKEAIALSGYQPQ